MSVFSFESNYGDQLAVWKCSRFPAVCNWWALRVVPMKESSRSKTRGLHSYFAITCLGCWALHHWLSWGMVSTQVITKAI